MTNTTDFNPDELIQPTNRRSLLMRGLALGFAAPAALPALRLAAQDPHGHDEPGTPEADDHSSEPQEHTEAPVPAV